MGERSEVKITVGEGGGEGFEGGNGGERINLEEHKKHAWFEVLKTPKMNGKLTDEELPLKIEETLASGTVSKEHLFAVLPQTNNLKVGDDAPNGTLFDIEGNKIMINDFFFRQNDRPTIINFGSYT